MAKAADPFAELESRERRITPRTLRGEKKKLWDQFVEKYHADEFAGISINELYEWSKEHCGLNCSLSCFRQQLMDHGKD